MQTRQDLRILFGEDELAKINRKLEFHPCMNTEPKALTPDQIDNFNRHGFIAPIDLFDGDEVVENKRYFDQALAEILAEGKDSYSIRSAHMSRGKAYDLVSDPRIVALVKDLLGEDVVGWGAHLFAKMPHDPKKTSWHQDASFWPLSESKAVTVWIAIDDSDIENACMRFLPGTHTLGHLTYNLSEQDDDNVLNQTVDNVEQYGEPYFDVLKAGQLSIHSDLLLHGSEANTSNRRRCGLTLRYSPVSVRAEMGWNKKGVIVAGSDPSGHWANPPRPEKD